MQIRWKSYLIAPRKWFENKLKGAKAWATGFSLPSSQISGHVTQVVTEDAEQSTLTNEFVTQVPTEDMEQATPVVREFVTQLAVEDLEQATPIVNLFATQCVIEVMYIFSCGNVPTFPGKPGCPADIIVTGTSKPGCAAPELGLT